MSYYVPVCLIVFHCMVSADTDKNYNNVVILILCANKKNTCIYIVKPIYIYTFAFRLDDGTAPQRPRWWVLSPPSPELPRCSPRDFTMDFTPWESWDFCQRKTWLKKHRRFVFVLPWEFYHQHVGPGGFLGFFLYFGWGFEQQKRVALSDRMLVCVCDGHSNQPETGPDDLMTCTIQDLRSHMGKLK